MSSVLPSVAYDLEIRHCQVDRGNRDNHGWTFGLPPGISQQQWPLDPVTSYPLMHGFTLLLPPDYRVHGADLVALSFFATAADQNDGGASPDAELTVAVLALTDTPPSNPALRPFWETGRRSHPHMHRMTDILGYAYALILLTREEFDGPLCPAPQISPASVLNAASPPGWLHCGSACAFYEFSGASKAATRILGGIPAQTLEENRAIFWSPRSVDPNAGKAPMESYSGAETPSGYESYFYWEGDVVKAENWRERPWAAGHKRDHVGGTMRPLQAIPEMSPWYIEFEEYFGGYNFGGGNAQLDFKDMKFDWACG